MSLESEMRQEITRLEAEIEAIDEELQKLQAKVVNLINIKKKKEYNMAVLKANFNDSWEEKEIQTDMKRLLNSL